MGPPGTGKTSTLLGLLEEELERGLSLNALDFSHSLNKLYRKERVEQSPGLKSTRTNYLISAHSTRYVFYSWG